MNVTVFVCQCVTVGVLYVVCFRWRIDEQTLDRMLLETLSVCVCVFGQMHSRFSAKAPRSNSQASQPGFHWSHLSRGLVYHPGRHLHERGKLNCAEMLTLKSLRDVFFRQSFCTSVKSLKQHFKDIPMSLRNIPAGFHSECCYFQCAIIFHTRISVMFLHSEKVSAA